MVIFHEYLVNSNLTAGLSGGYWGGDAVGAPRYSAQQESCERSFLKAWAQSLSPSPMEG